MPKKTIRKWDYTNLQTTLVNCASVKGSPVPAINHQGILHCICGRVKVVRRKDNKSIRFWKAIVFLSTEGYTCPDCKTVFYGVRASTQTIKRWKSKYPEEDWGRMNIVEK